MLTPMGLSYAALLPVHASQWMLEHDPLIPAQAGIQSHYAGPSLSLRVPTFRFAEASAD
jgi:hypothetical protein